MELYELYYMKYHVIASARKLRVVYYSFQSYLLQTLDHIFANSFLLPLLVCITGAQVYQYFSRPSQ